MHTQTLEEPKCEEANVRIGFQKSFKRFDLNGVRRLL